MTDRECIEELEAENQQLRDRLARISEALNRDAYGSTWCVVCRRAREILAETIASNRNETQGEAK